MSHTVWGVPLHSVGSPYHTFKALILGFLLTEEAILVIVGIVVSIHSFM